MRATSMWYGPDEASDVPSARSRLSPGTGKVAQIPKDETEVAEGACDLDVVRAVCCFEDGKRPALAGGARRPDPRTPRSDRSAQDGLGWARQFGSC